MSKQKDLVKNTLIIAVGKLSTQFLTFLLIPLYTNFLTTKEFGAVDLIMTYVAITVPLMAVSIERAVFRHLIDARESRVEQTRIIANSLHVYGIGLLVLTIIFALLQAFVQVPYGWLVYAVITAVSLSNFWMQVARGFGDNLKFSIASMIAGVTTVVLNIVLIMYLGWGAGGMLASIAIANIIAALYLMVVFRAGQYLHRDVHSVALKKQLLGYSAPLVPSNVAWWAISAADRTIIAVVLGVASNGIYAAAYKFPQIFSSLFSFFNLSWQESASMHVESKDRDSFYSRTMNASIKMFGALGLCVIAGTGLLFELLVGSAFHEARQYIPLLVIGVFFNSVLEIYSGVYIAKKMTKEVLKTSLAAAIINILITLLTIQTLGLYAPALAMIAAYFSMSVMRHYDLRKIVHIKYRLKTVVVISTLYVVVVMLYYVNTTASDLVAVAIATVAMLLLNRGFMRMMWNGISRKFSRKK